MYSVLPGKQKKMEKFSRGRSLHFFAISKCFVHGEQANKLSFMDINMVGSMLNKITVKKSQLLASKLYFAARLGRFTEC